MKKLADRSKEVLIIKKHCLGPFEGGRGRSMEVLSLIIYIPNIFGTLTSGRSIECGRLIN